MHFPKHAGNIFTLSPRLRLTLALLLSPLVTAAAILTAGLLNRVLWGALTALTAAGAATAAFSAVRTLSKHNQELEVWLHENTDSARLLVRKDRESSRANDEYSRVAGEFSEVGKVLVRRDIELSSANTRLEGLDLVKSEFVSVAAHQLRTPLTGVRWSLQSLVDGELGPLSEEQLKILNESLGVTVTATELISDLLDTARIEEGRFGFVPVEQDFLPIIEKVVNATRPVAKRKRVAFSISLPSVLPSI
ncbi:MAG: histidine kinase dimerization/phospho-acceptor domain-containing protein [Patescibacteria group bacterium]|nr:histidine kinase dimerization/phospho-acceptor domain-containing protein [Patescibacteria group bacterium]